MVEILLKTMQSYINADDTQDGRNKRNTQRSEVKITGNVLISYITLQKCTIDQYCVLASVFRNPL